MLSTGQISLQWLVQMVSLTLIFWLVIYPVDGPVQLWNNWGQVPVIQRVDNANNQINLYPVDNAIGFPNTYPLDSDLSNGLPRPALEELGPGLYVVYFNVAWDKSRYFPTPPLVKWSLRYDCRNFILLTFTTQIWVMLVIYAKREICLSQSEALPRYGKWYQQCRISAVVPQTSFGEVQWWQGEMSAVFSC